MKASSFAIQATLLPLIQKGSPLKDILDAVEVLIDSPVSFRPFDDMTICISSKSHPAVCQEEYLDFIHAGADYASQVLDEINDASINEYGYRLIISEKFTYSKYILGDISINGKYLGLLAIPETRIPLEEIDFSILHECGKMIALSWLVERSTHDTSKSKLLLALLQERIQSKTQLALFLKDNSILENKKWRLLAIKEPKDNLTDVVLILNSLLNIFDTAVYQGCICLLIAPQSTTIDELTINRLEAFADQFDTSIFISDEFDNLLECHHLFSQISVYSNKSIEKNKRVIFARDIKLFSLLCNCGLDSKQLKDYCDKRIISIILNDAQNDSALYDTICCYIDCCRSVSEVSKQLYVHSNTVFYRLNRLKQFDIDINNPSDIENIILTRALIDYIRINDTEFPFNTIS